MLGVYRGDLNLHGYEELVEHIIHRLRGERLPYRLWAKDPSLWRQGTDASRAIVERLGWLNVLDYMCQQADDIIRFSENLKKRGFTHAVLMGMGGSSLSPEVSCKTFGVSDGHPSLFILDSTVPESVLDIERKITLPSTLFIVSTKSGTTVETLSSYEYFFQKMVELKGRNASEHFIAITDAGTDLAVESEKMQFLRTFLNPPDIGGRYSALSYFGLVPAAVIGVDIRLLLERAKAMAQACGPDSPIEENPGIVLGVTMAELAKRGKDKLTFILSPEISAFGAWVEQLVAESTGKGGRGILPVDGEPLASSDKYGDDRLFVYLRPDATGTPELDRAVQALARNSHSVVTIRLNDLYDIGAEYFRWELATAVASALLGVNAFDEPNVKESKDNTAKLIAEFEQKGSFPEQEVALWEDGIALYCSTEMRNMFGRVLTLREGGADISSYLRAFLKCVRPGDYIAIMSFLHKTVEIEGALQEIRVCLRDATKSAVTLGYGPRFLHSTGQFHKGGPNNGLFIQLTADDAEPLPIPWGRETRSKRPPNFAVLKDAQALGDAIALQSRGKPFIRIHLGEKAQEGLNQLLKKVQEVTSREDF